MSIYMQRVGRIIFFVLCALAGFPLLPVGATSGLIALFFLLSIVTAISNYKTFNLKLSGELLVYILPFLIIFVWTIFIDGSSEAHFYLQRSLSLLVFPLSFFLLPFQFSLHQKNIFKTIFIASTLLVLVYGEVTAIQFLFSHVGPNEFWATPTEMFKHPSLSHLLRSTFENTTTIHPTYACLYLGVSFLFVFEYFLENFREFTVSKNIGYASLLIFIIVLQVILASRTPFIGTVISAFILFVIYQKNKLYILWAGIGIVVFTVLLFMLVPSFSARLKEISFENFTLSTSKNADSFNLRTGIYKCSIDIVEENWLTGVGPGNVQAKLDECYGKISSTVYNERKYDTHNQFLDYWAGMGILAPLSLLFLLLFISYKNLAAKNYIPFCLCILFFASMLTENILIRHHGVVAFAFIMSFYIFTKSHKEELANHKPVK